MGSSGESLGMPSVQGDGPITRDLGMFLWVSSIGFLSSFFTSWIFHYLFVLFWIITLHDGFSVPHGCTALLGTRIDAETEAEPGYVLTNQLPYQTVSFSLRLPS